MACGTLCSRAAWGADASVEKQYYSPSFNQHRLASPKEVAAHNMLGSLFGKPSLPPTPSSTSAADQGARGLQLNGGAPIGPDGKPKKICCSCPDTKVKLVGSTSCNNKQN
jgi:hypothetical protein